MNRAAIFNTAQHLFDDHPPAKLVTRMIASAARVSIGSVYRYFEDACDLLLSLFQHTNSGRAETLRDPDTVPDRQAFLDRAFHNLFARHGRHPAYGILIAYLRSKDRKNDDTAALIAMQEEVDMRLHRLAPAERTSMLRPTGIAITAYLEHHLAPARP
ncbi:TetR/AcrR family transcriptional regulator [uncultured Algimonas sp.]|uniref:TetR/AcrR family transcriptional regulator n=1 Tax=uncultured Algimonas sp. TaxID=1547920 RepID=UPI00260E36B0|nr:TetR/AcrR family transcriptional regulator [uncultured Algimonas sp.]